MKYYALNRVCVCACLSTLVELLHHIKSSHFSPVVIKIVICLFVDADVSIRLTHGGVT